MPFDSVVLLKSKIEVVPMEDINLHFIGILAAILFRKEKAIHKELAEVVAVVRAERDEVRHGMFLGWREGEWKGSFPSCYAPIITYYRPDARGI